MVTVRTNARLLELCGEEDLEAVVISADGGAPFVRECRALFCFIGAEPDTAWMDGVTRDGDGFVLTDVALAAADAAGPIEAPLPYQTSLPRVFAAGDVRAGSMKRVASAVGREPARWPPCIVRWAGPETSRRTEADRRQAVAGNLTPVLAWQR